MKIDFWLFLNLWFQRLCFSARWSLWELQFSFIIESQTKPSMNWITYSTFSLLHLWDNFAKNIFVLCGIVKIPCKPSDCLWQKCIVNLRFKVRHWHGCFILCYFRCMVHCEWCSLSWILHGLFLASWTLVLSLHLRFHLDWQKLRVYST